MDITFRAAMEADVELILQFIHELAEYERMTEYVVAEETTLREQLFEKRLAEVIFVLADGKEVGFALFFHSFSGFLVRAGLYLEDLFVQPEYRGKGCGKALLKHLAAIAVERGCGRMEWVCLRWNQPSIAFYQSQGAEPMNDGLVFRLSGDELRRAAEFGKDG